MNGSPLKFLSYVGVTAVMGLSAAYFYRTWQDGEPRWYFLFLSLAVALLLSFNLLTKRK